MVKSRKIFSQKLRHRCLTWSWIKTKNMITVSSIKKFDIWNHWHCLKIVQIRCFFWFVFSRMRTEYAKMLRISVFCPNAGKYRPEKTPYLDTFHTVWLTHKQKTSKFSETNIPSSTLQSKIKWKHNLSIKIDLHVKYHL